METNRRVFLQGALAMGAASFVATDAVASDYRFAVTGKTNNGYIAAVLDGRGSVLETYPLEGRGHGLCVSPDGRKLAIFARRPGFYIRVIDLVKRQIERDIEPVSGRHFYGHGFYAPDGQYLYATENDYEAERGVLGIYSVRKSYVRVGEIDTGGIGPHEAIMMSGGKTIAVANGGIATHPDFPRQKLNLNEMEPSLSLIDLSSGQIRSKMQLSPEMQKLSIRHIVEGRRGEVWFAGQYQGSMKQKVDIIGVGARNGDVELISLPQTIQAATKSYGGSISFNKQTGKIAVSAPRGGLLLVVDETTRKFSSSHMHQDVCAISPKGDGFIAATGAGVITSLDQSIGDKSNLRWDNHSLFLSEG